VVEYECARAGNHVQSLQKEQPPKATNTTLEWNNQTLQFPSFAMQRTVEALHTRIEDVDLLNVKCRATDDFAIVINGCSERDISDHLEQMQHVRGETWGFQFHTLTWTCTENLTALDSPLNWENSVSSRLESFDVTECYAEFQLHSKQRVWQGRNVGRVFMDEKIDVECIKAKLKASSYLFDAKINTELFHQINLRTEGFKTRSLPGSTDKRGGNPKRN
jgi:hypothetical protein